jgi:rubrerythrin
MGMRQKKCPTCRKKRPFDSDKSPVASRLNLKPLWHKIAGRWVCNWCVVHGRATPSAEEVITWLKTRAEQCPLCNAPTCDVKLRLKEEKPS